MGCVQNFDGGWFSVDSLGEIIDGPFIVKEQAIKAAISQENEFIEAAFHTEEWHDFLVRSGVK